MNRYTLAIIVEAENPDDDKMFDIGGADTEEEARHKLSTMTEIAEVLLYLASDNYQNARLIAYEEEGGMLQ